MAAIFKQALGLRGPDAGRYVQHFFVLLKQGYNGDLTSKQAGSVGGQMVKKMIEAYENGLK